MNIFRPFFSKKFALLSVIFVTVLLFFVSCGQKKDNAVRIPRNAFCVIMCDGTKFSNIGNLDENIFIKEYQSQLNMLAAYSPNGKKIVDNFLKDPNSLGIDMKGKIYGFASTDKLVGLYIPINRKKLEANINNIFADFQMEVSTFIKNKNEIFYMQPESEMIIGWNDNVAVILYANNEININSLENLMNLKSSESIMSNSDFKEFHKNCKDLNLWISSDFVPIFENEFSEKVMNLIGIDVANNYGQMIVELQRDRFIVTSTFKVNKTIQKIDQNKLYENRKEIEKEFGNPIKELIESFLGTSSPFNFGNDNYDDFTDEEYQQLLEELEEIEEVE